MRRAHGQPAWGTVAVTALVLLGSGFGLVRAARVRGAASVRKSTAPVVAATAPAPAPEAPEMPSLLVGPPAPEKPAAETPASGGPRVVHGPMWKLPPLPPVPGGVVGAIPAVPIRVVRRALGGDLNAGGPPLLPDPNLPAPAVPGLPPRPARSAETSAAKPLTLRLRAVPSANSIQGPGQWLKIRASASVPCYVVVFHVTGSHKVRIVFPRRFDLVYEPNTSYTLLDRADPGDSGEIVVAVASVYPMTAADALAAIRASRALAPAAARGPLGTELWEALEANLKGKAGGSVHIKQWEPHAWRVAMAMHRSPPPAPEGDATESGAPAPAPPAPRPGNTGAPAPSPSPSPAAPDKTPAPATPPATPSGGESPARKTGGGSPP